MGNTLVKKSLLGVGLRYRVSRDPENAGGGGTGGSDETSNSAGDDPGDDSEDEGGDEEEKGKARKDSEKSKTVPESKYLQIKKHLAEADRKKQEALDELKTLKLKDLPEAEKLRAEHEEAVKERDSYKGKFESMARTNAFLRASADLKVNWNNATAALKLADLDDLEINDDGSVDGIKDAVKALAKDHPYLVASSTTDDSTNGKGPSKSGSPVGSKQSAKKSNGELSDEELKKRFPALY